MFQKKTKQKQKQNTKTKHNTPKKIDVGDNNIQGVDNKKQQHTK